MDEALKEVDQHEMETFGPIGTPETDPNGTDPHTPGAKLDAGKLRAGLVLDDFALALTAVAAVGTVGAAKYTPHGWLSVPDAEARYTDAQRRHELAHAIGEENDPDTDLPHLAHAAWNALARLQLALQDGEWCHHELQATTKNNIAGFAHREARADTLEQLAEASAEAGLYKDDQLQGEKNV
jgi:hypothetical protein